MRVCVVAGGTGGHILPGVAAAKALRERGHRVHFITKTDKTTQPFLAREGFPSSSFYYAGFPRKISLDVFAYPFLTIAAFLNSRRILKREESDVVLAMGGYISVPVGLAARYMKIPLVLHEQNSRAGLANRFLARRADAVAVSFERTENLPVPTEKLIFTGLPLRPDLVPKDPADSRAALGLDPAAPTLLIFGGSQGARALNRLVTAALENLNTWQVIHITGEVDRAAVGDFYKKIGRRAFVKSYWSDMAAVYSAADFVIGRSGANSVMEMARMGKRALLSPFPFATDDHQTANARFLEERGLARVVQEKDLTPEKLAEILNALPPVEILRRENREYLERDSGRAGAADKLADVVEKAAENEKK